MSDTPPGEFPQYTHRRLLTSVPVFDIIKQVNLIMAGKDIDAQQNELIQYIISLKEKRGALAEQQKALVSKNVKSLYNNFPLDKRVNVCAAYAMGEASRELESPGDILAELEKRPGEPVSVKIRGYNNILEVVVKPPNQKPIIGRS